MAAAASAARASTGRGQAARDARTRESTEAAGIQRQLRVADGDGTSIFFAFENKQKMMRLESLPQKFTGTADI